MKNLLAKTVAGFLFLMLMMTLALFLTAGSAAYWQGWAYLATFAGCTLWITLDLFRNDQQLLERRVKGGPVAEKQRNQQLIQSLANLFFILLFIIPGLDYRFHWSKVHAAISLVSDGVVTLGFYIVSKVFKENSFTSATIEVVNKQVVISSGPYRLVRHPMYAGAFLLLLFTPLALGSWISILLPLPLFLVIVLRLLDEEKYLLANLAGYGEYCKQVRFRIIPGVW